jgi:hypothetical protein
MFVVFQVAYDPDHACLCPIDHSVCGVQDNLTRNAFCGCLCCCRCLMNQTMRACNSPSTPIVVLHAESNLILAAVAAALAAGGV